MNVSLDITGTGRVRDGIRRGLAFATYRGHIYKTTRSLKGPDIVFQSNPCLTSY